jgi:hypothetical protein
VTAPELEAQSLVDPFLLAHLDEDWAVPCEMGQTIERAGGSGCSATAEWIAWAVRCCPDRTSSVLLCSGHKSELIATPKPGVCSHCDEVFFPGRTGFRLIEPLNRRPM